MGDNQDERTGFRLHKAEDWGTWVMAFEGLLYRKECYASFKNCRDNLNKQTAYERALATNPNTAPPELKPVDGDKLAKAYGYLMNSIHRDLYETIRPAQHNVIIACELLHKRFHTVSGTTAGILRLRLQSLRLGPNKEPETLFNEINDICHLLESQGRPADDVDKITAIMRALPPDYDSVTSDINKSLAKGEDISYMLVCDWVKLFSITKAALNFKLSPNKPDPKQTRAPGDMALPAVETNGNRGRPRNKRLPTTPCPKCKKMGHWASDCKEANRPSARQGRDRSGSFPPGRGRSCHAPRSRPGRARPQT